VVTEVAAVSLEGDGTSGGLEETLVNVGDITHPPDRSFSNAARTSGGGALVGGAFAKAAGAGLAGIFVGGASGPLCCDAVGSELGGALHGIWQSPAELAVGRAGAAGGIFIGAAFVDAGTKSLTPGAPGGAFTGGSPATISAGRGLLGVELFGKAIANPPGSISAGCGLLGIGLFATVGSASAAVAASPEPTATAVGAAGTSDSIVGWKGLLPATPRPAGRALGGGADLPPAPKPAGGGFGGGVLPLKAAGGALGGKTVTL